MQTGALLASAVQAADISSLAFDEVKRRFLALFPRRSGSIWKKPGNKRWFTQHSFELSDQQIFAAVEGKLPYFAGARFGPQTRFAVIDIDTSSPYHNVLSLVRLRRALELVGLHTTYHYQSSDSGGWHLWIFFDELVKAEEVNKLISAWLKNQGFKLGSGVLEIFPSANGLRIPLQPGFRWLSDNESRAELTLEQALRRFIFDSAHTNDWRTAADSIASRLASEIADRRVQKRRSGLIPERWKQGQELWRTGLQRAGQRHDAMLAVEHYLWYGDEGIEALPGFHNDDARERLLIDWLERKHNGMCRHINRGDWRKVLANIQRACRWRTSANTHTPYAHTERKIERMMEEPSLTPRRFITGNIARYNYALKRITVAYDELARSGRTPSINEVAEKAGAHWNTVRKHWDHLTGSSGDQNPGIDRPVAVPSIPEVVVVPFKPVQIASTPNHQSDFVLTPLKSSRATACSFTASSLSFVFETPTVESVPEASKVPVSNSLPSVRSLPALDLLRIGDIAKPVLEPITFDSNCVHLVVPLLRLFVGIGLCLRLLL